MPPPPPPPPLALPWAPVRPTRAAAAAAAPPRRVAIDPGRGQRAKLSLCAHEGTQGLRCKQACKRGVGGAKRRERAGSVHGAGGVAGTRARGVGGELGAPRVNLGRLAPASMTKKRKVTSTPEVPGPSRSWNPAPATPSSPFDLRTRPCVPARQQASWPTHPTWAPDWAPQAHGVVEMGVRSCTEDYSELRRHLIVSTATDRRPSRSSPTRERCCPVSWF